MIARGPHLGEYFVKPLKGAVKVDFYPARGGRNVLSVIFCSPTFHERHPYRAHLCELVNCLKSQIDRLSEQSCKLLVVEDLEAAARGDLADCGGVEAVVIVAVPALYEDGAIGQTFSVHLAPHVIKVNTLANVPSRVLYGRVPVDIAELAKTEPVVVLDTGVGEPVDDNAVTVGVVHLSHPTVQLIVGNTGPVDWLLIRHRI